MRRASLSSAALMLVIGQLAALDHAAPVDRRPTTPTPAPRRFTDARKAEAEAKPDEDVVDAEFSEVDDEQKQGQ